MNSAVPAESPIPSFGEDGRIDLRKGLRGNYMDQPVVLTSPAIIYKDLISAQLVS